MSRFVCRFVSVPKSSVGIGGVCSVFCENHQIKAGMCGQRLGRAEPVVRCGTVY